MSISKLLSCILAACIIINLINTSEPPIVVACSFDVLSKNADTGNIISNAVKSATQILSCFYWSSLMTLPATIKHMQQRGVEIAATTPGITNTIKQLFIELEEKQYGKFTDTAINCFNEMGVNPIPDRNALSLLEKIKTFNIPTIGMGNQDSTEHVIYARKMLQEHNIRVHELFDGIVTIPTLEEQTTFALGSDDCFMRNAANPLWLVARSAAPSPYFTQTIRILGHNLSWQAPLLAIDSKEQLEMVVNALQMGDEQRTQSPEDGRIIDTIMQQGRVISPTRV